MNQMKFSYRWMLMACLAVFLFGLLLAAGCNNTHKDGFSVSGSVPPTFVILPTAQMLTASPVNHLITVGYSNFRIQDIDNEGSELFMEIVDVSMPDICGIRPCFVVPTCTFFADSSGCTVDCFVPDPPAFNKWKECIFPLPVGCFEGSTASPNISDPGELPGWRSFQFKLFSECLNIPFGGVSADITFRASDADGGETFLTLTLRDNGPPLP